jgi:dihydroxycyclohexadiene carboxylate dehydrogenase
MRFTDKVVAITGAAQGIGRQTAEQAAAEGAALLLIDRSPYVHELAATLAQSGCQVLALEALSSGRVPSRRLPPGSLILAASTC